MRAIQPTIDVIQNIITEASTETVPANLYPVFSFIPADTLTPHNAYLKLTKPGSTEHGHVASRSFLFESAFQDQSIGRYSYIGVNPRKSIVSGNGFGPDVDPLTLLEEELKQYKQAKIPEVPALSGGAVGYVGYDCIKYFEPSTRNDELKDILKVPEAVLMLFDTIVAFDHVYQRIQIITNIYVPRSGEAGSDNFDLGKAYKEAKEIIDTITAELANPVVPAPPQPPIVLNQQFTSNVGQAGYESHVSNLKKHIKAGDIFQCVPSQRVARPTTLHPFNIYRHLRTVNPSPYLFYIDLLDFQIVGASPELLVKSEKGRIINHPIAGTVKRGKTLEEDEALALELSSSLKDRSEHVMLVDLARNDINRVCDPMSTSVDRLMTVERFSHVMHLVSQVSGVLRPDKSRFDAFRSIFPAGTVSGAPKVKAMKLISQYEGERRGIYAGAVGHWGYDDTSMDTCIALRTMVCKDGIAYLQAGGGIVYDSDEYDEYIETINKMGANKMCIHEAEQIWYDKQHSS
ncbi:anthranilate synthase component [Nadsonia fulvescens var. elongata DSM 6958]|uniref:anthranilate synthase n=1 Tax=Nadsonia fulvescens var. elongata DSM 6958 TaxID=857566 RepID=A0A1E3PND2_9ASCO|nr:anthranilate synthase component [Nadsonia fulvescens var. elongata DSM 6958]